jgi:hypothetical protein
MSFVVCLFLDVCLSFACVFFLHFRLLDDALIFQDEFVTERMFLQDFISQVFSFPTATADTKAWATCAGFFPTSIGNMCQLLVRLIRSDLNTPSC